MVSNNSNLIPVSDDGPQRLCSWQVCAETHGNNDTTCWSRVKCNAPWKKYEHS